MELTREMIAELRKPFSSEIVGLKIQAVFPSKEQGGKDKALIVPFIDSRDVMDRLDDVVGGDWFDNYAPAPKGGLECALTVCGVTRRDVGSDDNDTEAEKSGYSDSFKRAAVKFGVGRYLYSIPKMYADVVPVGKSHRLADGEERRLRGLLPNPKAESSAPSNSRNTTGNTLSSNTATLGKEEELKAETAAEQKGETTQAPKPAPKSAAPKPEAKATDKVFSRQHPPLSPVQRNKLMELWRILHGGSEQEGIDGLDKLFKESFKRGINDATYEDGARVTGQLLTELRNKSNSPTN